jgi:hypothetical protein
MEDGGLQRHVSTVRATTKIFSSINHLVEHPSDALPLHIDLLKVGDREPL